MSQSVDTPRARFKLGEVGFFLVRLQERHREPQKGLPNEFAYYLSAFLNAAYSLTEMLEREGKTALKAGAANRGRAKKQYETWKETWVNNLADDMVVWTLMEQQRWQEVHEFGAKTIPEKKIIPMRPHGGIYGPFVVGPPAMYAESWLEHKRKLGLPSWADAWWEAQVHHFDVDGERQHVVSVCERYLHLLTRLLDEFQAWFDTVDPRGPKAK
jgi:hypothetical protein